MEAGSKALFRSADWSSRRSSSLARDSTTAAFKPRSERNEFLTEVIGSEGRISVMEFSKTRWEFELGTSQAEFTIVVVNGLTAIQQRSNRPIRMSCCGCSFEIELDEAENLSYARYVKCALGREKILMRPAFELSSVLAAPRPSWYEVDTVTDRPIQRENGGRRIWRPRNLNFSSCSKPTAAD
jgi:hypothetical protein